MHSESTGEVTRQRTEPPQSAERSELQRKLIRAERKIEILEALIQDRATLVHPQSSSPPALATPRDGPNPRWSFIQDLLDESNESILAIDLMSGLIIEANQGACRNLGYSPDEIRSLCVTDIEAILPDEFQWATHALHVKAAGSMAMEGMHLRKRRYYFPRGSPRPLRRPRRPRVSPRGRPRHQSTQRNGGKSAKSTGRTRGCIAQGRNGGRCGQHPAQYRKCPQRIDRGLRSNSGELSNVGARHVELCSSTARARTRRHGPLPERGPPSQQNHVRW